MNSMHERLKWLLFPGINLHARLRRQLLPAYFGKATREEERFVLDAGCGNGMLSYCSYLKGNRVRGISIKEKEVKKCRRFFNDFLGIPQNRLRFEIRNLYDLDASDGEYDEIICSEVIEHLSDDRKVATFFHDRLTRGGVLHLCTPNAEHPDNIAHHLDENEHGGHVRPGYTTVSLRALVEHAGFTVKDIRGIGGPIRQAFNKRIIETEQRFGFPIAFPIFLAAQLFVWMDPTQPQTPYSIYLRAVKDKP